MSAYRPVSERSSGRASTVAPPEPPAPLPPDPPPSAAPAPPVAAPPLLAPPVAAPPLATPPLAVPPLPMPPEAPPTAGAPPVVPLLPPPSEQPAAPIAPPSTSTQVRRVGAKRWILRSWGRRLRGRFIESYRRSEERRVGKEGRSRRAESETS